MGRRRATDIVLVTVVVSCLAGALLCGCSDQRVADASYVRRGNQEWALGLLGGREARCANNLDDLARQLEQSGMHHERQLRRSCDSLDRAYRRERERWPDLSREAAERFRREMSGDPANIDDTIPRIFY